MIKKTAMQEFIKWGDKMMRDYPMKELGFGQAIDKAIELLEMEKEQIIDAYKFGLTDEYVIGSDKYYNSTYGSKGSDETMTSERIKEIQQQTAYPDSVSVQQALLQVWNECSTSSQTEISDEEIEKGVNEHFVGDLMWSEKIAFKLAIKWYREQLKKK